MLYSSNNKFASSYAESIRTRIDNRVRTISTRLGVDEAAAVPVDVENVTSRKKKKLVPKFDVKLAERMQESSTCDIFAKESDDKYDLSFTVYGEPIPLSRHMVARGRMYNPSAKAQKLFADACTDKLPITPMDGPLEAHLIFYFSRPKNHYGTGKNSNTLKDNVDTWHSKRKDLDNLIKFVLDSLNSKAYLDDSQICVINSAKLYTNSDPRIEVRMRKLSPINVDT